MKLFLDLDGTVADLNSAVKLFELELRNAFGMDKLLSFPDAKYLFREYMVSERSDAFRNLELINIEKIRNFIEVNNISEVNVLSQLPAISSIAEHFKTFHPDENITAEEIRNIHIELGIGKGEWVDNVLKPALNDLIKIKCTYILPGPGMKRMFCIRDNDILIDDFKSNISAWRKRGGIGVLTGDLTKAPFEKLTDFINKLK